MVKEEQEIKEIERRVYEFGIDTKQTQMDKDLASETFKEDNKLEREYLAQDLEVSQMAREDATAIFIRRQKQVQEI